MLPATAGGQQLLCSFDLEGGFPWVGGDFQKCFRKGFGIAGFEVVDGVVAEIAFHRSKPAGDDGLSEDRVVVGLWVIVVLTILDPHLTMRGVGDLVFPMLAMIQIGGAMATRPGVVGSPPRTKEVKS